MRLGNLGKALYSMVQYKAVELEQELRCSLKVLDRCHKLILQSVLHWFLGDFRS